MKHDEQEKSERTNRFTNIFKRSKNKQGTSDLTKAPLATQSDQSK
jgi:hypothetical protein